MVKNNEKKEMSFVTHLTGGQKEVIQDKAHKSKAFVPIPIDSGNSVEVVQVDGGLITGLLPGGGNLR